MRDLNKAQLKCVRELEKGFETNQRQVLAWYTGAGKTNIFLALAARILKKNPKAKVGHLGLLAS
jgi:primosomal protein N'